MVELGWEHRESDGRLVLKVDGAAAGELTYTRGEPGVIVADHTYVDPIHRGRGYAQQLVDELVRWARRDGLKIEPACWYVRQQLEADPALIDLIAA
jgi:predicted GNAT family acetyltransferase